MLRRLFRSAFRELFTVAFQVAVYLGVFSGLIALVVKLEPLTHDMAIAAIPLKPQWVAAERSLPAFAASVPDIPDPHPGYTILRDPVGGGRRDIMTFAGRGRSVTLEVYRPGDELAQFGTFASDIAARIKPYGEAGRIAKAPAIETRFGLVELYDFTLTTESKQRGCLGFVRNQTDPSLQIIGWACQSGPEMVMRPTVACAIDRLTLLSAGNDANLAKFFAHAEVKGTFCPAKGPHGPRVGAMAAWMEAGRAPRLRTQPLRR